MLAEMTASDVCPAGISCAVTFSVGWAAFQACTTCQPQATSSSPLKAAHVIVASAQAGP
jgi:hypothetical protein